jgi:Fe-Mn family superoxide dismutase
MKHTLADLPYDLEALEPFLMKETLYYHHDKHHAGYVNKLNTLIKGTEYEEMSLEYIITQSDGAIFNNAAQTFNHNFYWNCLSPVATQPSDTLLRKIIDTFGSMDKLKEEFLASALNNFGSGWTWLVLDQHEHLKIVNTSNAQTPIAHHETPLLTCDVWEHAYYLNYQNRRPDYIEAFFNVINWNEVERRYAEAK